MSGANGDAVRVLWRVEDVEMDRRHLTNAKRREQARCRRLMARCIERTKLLRAPAGVNTYGYIQGVMACLSEMERAVKLIERKRTRV